MAITKIDFPTASTPSYTPSISTDYNNQNEYIERNARGYINIELTNWDATTTKPQIVSGSVIEANGSTWDISATADISTSGASSGTIYLYFDDTTPEFKFSDTAPTWSVTLNGWYNSNDRFTGHACTWDGASSFSAKYMYDGNHQNSDITLKYADGDIGISGTITATSIIIGSGASTGEEQITAAGGGNTTTVLTAGYFSGFKIFAASGATVSARLECYENHDGSPSWEEISTVSGTAGSDKPCFFPLISNGSNYRVYIQASGNPGTVYGYYYTI